MVATMKPFLLLFTALVAFLPQTDLGADNAAKPDDRLAWSVDARLGILIHWGIYAVDGIDESWAFFNGYVPTTITWVSYSTPPRPYPPLQAWAVVPPHWPVVAPAQQTGVVIGPLAPFCSSPPKERVPPSEPR